MGQWPSPTNTLRIGYFATRLAKGGQVNSTDYDGPDTYEEDIDAAMKARIEEDRWSQ